MFCLVLGTLSKDLPNLALLDSDQQLFPQQTAQINSRGWINVPQVLDVYPKSNHKSTFLFHSGIPTTRAIPGKHIQKRRTAGDILALVRILSLLLFLSDFLFFYFSHILFLHLFFFSFHSFVLYLFILISSFCWFWVLVFFLLHF